MPAYGSTQHVLATSVQPGWGRTAKFQKTFSQNARLATA